MKPVVQRGFTTIEFLIAITITSLIAVASTGLIMAIAQATDVEEDRRETVVRAQAVEARLSSYVTMSRYILGADSTSVVIWLDDSRETGTVNLSEIRWIYRNTSENSVRVDFVVFPDEWTELQRTAADIELTVDSDWWTERRTAEAQGLIRTLRLSDRVSSLGVEHDSQTQAGQRLVTFRVTFGGDTGDRTVVAASSIRELQEPDS
ncbi:MAG: PulJ/GspJ family protein [Planctomycetota bacterium]